MPFEGSARTINEQQGSTRTTLVPKPAASPKHNSGNSEPPLIQQVSGPVRPAQVGHRKVSVPVSPAEVGHRDQMESVNTDLELEVGHNKNLNKDAPQKIGKTRIGNTATTSQSGGSASVFKDRRARLVVGGNENEGTTQEIGDVELFNDDGHRGSGCCMM